MRISITVSPSQGGNQKEKTHIKHIVPEVGQETFLYGHRKVLHFMENLLEVSGKPNVSLEFYLEEADCPIMRGVNGCNGVLKDSCDLTGRGQCGIISGARYIYDSQIGISASHGTFQAEMSTFW